jgi:gliding motility-associated-like protein
MRTIRYALLSLILIVTAFSARASHIIGGEIYYVCTGPNTYEITMVIYRDCTSFTAFDNPAYLGIYDEDGNLVENLAMSPPDVSDIPIEVDNPCLVVPPGLCIEQAIYVEEVTLPDDGQTYDLVYQRCCRNAGIVNIEIPDDTGSTYWQQIPPGEDAECNSSPYFNNYPPSVICVSDPINFDHSATDPDGDSLAYKFYTPYAGASPFDPAPSPPPPPPFDDVEWETGYDVDYPIDASPDFAIDVNTGLLTGTATDEGRYVFGVVVEEWRDGVLLGEHIRDFQFNVEFCEPTIIAELGIEGEVVTDYYLDCEDFTINFDNFSTGADDYLWLFGDGGTSEEFEPVHVYPDTGVYTVSLICNPGFVCADTFTSEIWIYNTLTAGFTYDAGCSGDAVSFTDASVSTEAGNIDSWTWDFGDGSTGTGANPDHEYAIGGSYDVILTVTTDKGCTSTISQAVDLLSGPTADFDVDDVCLNEEAMFSDETTFPAGVTLETWDWSFGDGNTSSNQNPGYFYGEAGTYDVTLIVSTNNGCEDTITQTIVIGELPFPDAGPNDTVNYLDYYTLMGSGNGTFSWTPAGLVSNPSIANPEIRPSQTLTYYLSVTSPDGCTAIDSVTIYVDDFTIVEVPNAFSPNNDGVNDTYFILSYAVAEFYEFSIYNRWGQQVFTTTDINAGWDGTFEGKEQEMGAYVYVVRAQDLSGEDVQLQGTFMLIR